MHDPSKENRTGEPGSELGRVVKRPLRLDKEMVGSHFLSWVALTPFTPLCFGFKVFCNILMPYKLLGQRISILLGLIVLVDCALELTILVMCPRNIVSPLNIQFQVILFVFRKIFYSSCLYWFFCTILLLSIFGGLASIMHMLNLLCLSSIPIALPQIILIFS